MMKALTIAITAAVVGIAIVAIVAVFIYVSAEPPYWTQY